MGAALLLTGLLWAGQTADHSLAKALKHANHTYSQAEPLPKAAPAFAIHDAVQEFRDIIHRFGPVPAARQGLARCLLHQARFAEAAHAFRSLGRPFAPQAASCSRLAKIGSELKRHFPGKKVVSLKQVPRSDTFVAVVAKRSATTEWMLAGLEAHELVLFKLRAHGVTVLETRALANDDPRHLASFGYSGSNWGGGDDLYIAESSLGSHRFFAIVYQSFAAADCAPAMIHVVELRPNSFGPSHPFATLTEGSGVLAARPGHGLVVYVAPTFKVWWTDAYEWRSGRFRLANRANSSVYSGTDYAMSDADCDHCYNYWMDRAAIKGIRGDYRGAPAAWRRAERACLNYLRYGKNQALGLAHSPYLPEDRSNLAEIRKRIRWLKAGDLGHTLLYRPYNFDVQAQPYYAD